ncbi:MAG TPA: glycosyltransferase family 2 protein [Oculatellaceae cyanobacterium]
MAVSKLTRKNSKRRLLKGVFRLRVAMLVMLSVVAASAIAVAWFTGEGTLSQLFAHLQALQENSTIWLEVPETSSKYYLLAPTAVLCLISLAVVKISPQPRTWSRVVVVSIILALTIRYLLWRSLFTLNLSNPLDGVFSLGLFFMEVFLIFSNSFQLFLILRVKPRHREADKMAVAVMDGSFTPSVDILIPTYDEPTFILRRTIIGCQALEYANKKIYLLDDTRRQEMQCLAEELGCEYITRPDNRHAKAGNLNNAIAQTSGELIAVFDADFVPTKNFLTRTIGFFQNQKIALVQSQQSFYNPDPVARNLGLENLLTHESEAFSRYYQLLRDGVDTALCYGSSFVTRRSALEEIGGFVTESVSEDYFTGVRLSAQGYRVIYLGERLSAGLSAENMADHVAQRLRWARGSLQAFFIKANPLTIPGLRPLQRLAHLEGLLQWFTSLFRLGFLLMPLAYLFLGVIPLRTTVTEWLYFFLPYYLVQILTFSWLNYRSRGALISDIYSVAQCFPISLTIIQTLLSPFSTRFKVTPKGISRNRFHFNWALAWPLIILFIATAVSLWWNLRFALMSSGQQLVVTSGDAKLVEGMGLAWIWSAYNLLMIAIALLILLDVPKPDWYEWFDLKRIVSITVEDTRFWGVTTKISEGGVEVALTETAIPEQLEKLPLKLKIMEEELELPGQVAQISFAGELPKVRIAFEQLSLPQYRRLVEMLFCRPGQWKRHNTPGELRSLWLLLRIFLKPRVLFDQSAKLSARQFPKRQRTTTDH